MQVHGEHDPADVVGMHRLLLCHLLRPCSFADAQGPAAVHQAAGCWQQHHDQLQQRLQQRLLLWLGNHLHQGPFQQQHLTLGMQK
jgi:hypothetical protein